MKIYQKKTVQRLPISVSEASKTQLELEGMSRALAEAESEAQMIAKEEALLEMDDSAEEQGEQKFIEIVTDREKEFL